MFPLVFSATATTEIYTLSLHDALPISRSTPTFATRRPPAASVASSSSRRRASCSATSRGCSTRSEEHTSELQSHSDLVCRLLLEKKNREDDEAARGHGALAPARWYPPT